ncbi:MAG: hypothetical protein E3J47_03110 [Candidatus Stahlbacteria bacterium]|nr:MAG: hypothetical protein E3J47_03110 [Candidatus Stahlbacteria bacterium]
MIRFFSATCTAVVSILICACSTATMASLSKREKEKMQTTLFKAPYLKVFIAIVEVFHDKEYYIENADEWLGSITTKWKVDKDVRRKINATLEGVAENTTKVRLKYSVQKQTERGWYSTEDDMRIYIAKKYYKKYFDLIRRKLKRK